MVSKYDDVFSEDLGDGVIRRVLIHDRSLMMVEVSFKKGAVGAIHSHIHEQISYILSGSFEFTLGDEKFIVKKGDTYYTKPNIPHGVKALEDSVILDTFTPIRKDFLK